MNNIDHDQLIRAIKHLDSDIGIDSDVHKDTITALSLIVLRGKELRNHAKHRKVKDRYYYVIEYLRRIAPNLDKDLLKLALFREGIIHESYITFANIIIPLLLFLFLFIGNLLISWSKNGADEFFITFLLSLLSLLIAGICGGLIEVWSNSKLGSYFFIGHRNEK